MHKDKRTLLKYFLKLKSYCECVCWFLITVDCFHWWAGKEFWVPQKTTNFFKCLSALLKDALSG
jgi:hypothetical protein